MTDKEKLIQRIKDVICAGERIPEADLQNKSQKKELVQARYLIMYFLRLFNLGSQAVVGEMYGKDHSTCLHAEKTINNRIDTDKVFAAMVEHYRKQILDEQMEVVPFDKPELIELKNKSLIEENTALKAQIKILEDEVFRLQSRLQQVRPAKGESIRPYMGYVPAFRQ